MDFSRRNFLKMNHGQSMTPLRPPWSLEEQGFQQACIRCETCVQVCPEKILVRENHHGYPYVDFTLGACSFCGLCAVHCPTAALGHTDESPWHVVAEISIACLTKQNVVCTSCAEVCDVSAIQFSMPLNRVAMPQVHVQDCHGCGACVAMCPTKAIEVKSCH